MSAHCKDEGMAIRKGPWMAEEDEILMEFVKKNGPRDWSSIRSKGLLPRTGKSCRLRWVNKLKPDLKTGCKFSTEEEHVVIDLQAQFGNKWARIASYLPGRTDNDVKNFWSSRQKRLARILKASSESKKSHGKFPNFDEVQAPSLGSSMQSQEESSNGECGMPSFVRSSDVIKMVQLPDLIKPNSVNLETEFPSLRFKADDQNPCLDIRPQFPFTHLPHPTLELPDLPESQGLMCGSSDMSILDAFACRDALESESDLVSSLRLPFADLNAAGPKVKRDDPPTPESFFDDFPADMFDYLEPLPSSSEW